VGAASNPLNLFGAAVGGKCRAVACVGRVVRLPLLLTEIPV